MWGGGAIPHNKYRSSTLVGLMTLRAAFSTGSIFDACDGLLQTGDAYLQRSNTVMLQIIYMYSRETNKSGRAERQGV